MLRSAFASITFAAAIAVAGVAAVVSPASAADRTDMTDSTYLAIAHCAGVSDGLGSDASGFDKILSDQDVGRQSVVLDRAKQVRDQTASNTRRAGADTKGHLKAELDGACKAYIN